MLREPFLMESMNCIPNVFAFRSPILDSVPLCLVSFVDTESIAHSVEVEARTLYEAGALALAEFRNSGVVDHIGPAIRLQIEVRRPVTRHELSVEKVDAWLASGSKSPSEQAVKARIRETWK